MKTLSIPELSDFATICIDGEVWRIALGNVWQGSAGIRAQSHERVIEHEKDVQRAIREVGNDL